MHKSIFGLFSVVLLTGSAFAAIQPIRQSGIDLDASTIDVVFDDELDGITPNPGCTGGTFAQLGVSVADDPLIIEIDDSSGCFESAGIYDLTINLVDQAGNAAPPNSVQFTVKASDPDGPSSTFTEVDCEDKAANGDDICQVELQIKDQFGNPVTQLDGGSESISSAQIESGSDFETKEANEMLSFLSGLRLGGTSLTGAPMSFVSPATATLDFTAFAPSIIRHGFLSRLSSAPVDLNLSLPAIDVNGATTTNTNITFNHDFQFRHLFKLEPSSVDTFFINGPAAGIDVSSDEDPDNPDHADVSSVNGEMKTLNDVYTFADENLDDWVLVDGTGVNGGDQWWSSLGDHIGELFTAISNADEGMFVGDTDLPLLTRVTYTLDSDKTVRYIAGGTGLDEAGNDNVEPCPAVEPFPIGFNCDGINTRVVGVDVEGGILGSLDEMLLQGGEDGVAFLMGSAEHQDLRKQMRENAFRLIRGAENPLSGDQPIDASDFSATDVVVVEDGIATIDMSGTSGVLPSGQKTLVVLNGNVVISSDMTYGDNADSFGVITITEDIQSTDADRIQGHILVKNSVQMMSASLYADGALISINNSADLTHPASFANIAAQITNTFDLDQENNDQLLLLGTLMSRNTIGGSMILSDAGEYFTPWGTTSDEDLAIAYDLHLVRRYFPGAGGSPIAAADPNTNAFVIRPDGKVTNTPPPGFELLGVIGR